ncbi:YeeE/YedE family protein [Algivirga pacifica]|uniref:YeeE/YedE thiosulfate transporter family protein n=1 Tax=Algivirga pacifica TaxID=1162670 RepID=A0ABP9CY30_9BACT
MEWILQPWPWYVSGPLITLTMALLLFAGKSFGVSANLRVICSACGAGKKNDFFNFNWKAQRWNLLFVIGAVIGGFISANFMNGMETPEIAESTKASLAQMGVQADETGLLPQELFGTEALFTLKGFLILVIGGFLVGFGARYAGGCTSGHAISGLSNLQLPSLIAVVGFFIGGLLMTHILLPLILSF